MEKDPVCGMDVDPKTTAHKSNYQGKMYYFCSLGCKRDFDKDPQKFLKGGIQVMQHGNMHKHSS